ncbi:MAG: hypothetical protein ACI9UK_002009 [Candidatus Krumholzibacteriia bacterium]|jgi:hypothetical protein
MRTMAIAILIFCVCAPAAHADSALGPRMGLTGDNDDFFLGAQLELMAKFGSFSLVPSFDFGPGTDAPSVANADFRLYLIPLPETGIRFYAGAGPTMMLSGDLELGLSLTLGLNIPMKESRRYNIEYRWGLGDIPDHKIGVSVLYGL